MKQQQTLNSSAYWKKIEAEEIKTLSMNEFKALFPYEVIDKAWRVLSGNKILLDYLPNFNTAQVIRKDDRYFVLVVDFEFTKTHEADEPGVAIMAELVKKRRATRTYKEVVAETESMLKHWRKYGYL